MAPTFAKVLAEPPLLASAVERSRFGRVAIMVRSTGSWVHSSASFNTREVAWPSLPGAWLTALTKNPTTTSATAR